MDTGFHGSNVGIHASRHVTLFKLTVTFITNSYFFVYWPIFLDLVNFHFCGLLKQDFLPAFDLLFSGHSTMDGGDGIGQDIKN